MLLTEIEAAQFAKVDRRTIRKLITSGRLRALDFGTGRRRYRVALADLQAISPAPARAVPVETLRKRHRRVPSIPSTSTYLPSA